MEKEWAEPVVTLGSQGAIWGSILHMLWLLRIGEGTKVCTALQTDGAL